MKKRLYLAGGGLVLAAAVGLLWWSSWRAREPVYNGKPISYWVGDGFTWASGPPDWKAVREIEGDAIPCLVGRVNARPSWFDRSYTYLYLKLVAHLPAKLAGQLPHPHTEANYNQRGFAALVLLGFMRGVRTTVFHCHRRDQPHLPPPRPRVASRVQFLRPSAPDMPATFLRHHPSVRSPSR